MRFGLGHDELEYVAEDASLQKCLECVKLASLETPSVQILVYSNVDFAHIGNVGLIRLDVACAPYICRRRGNRSSFDAFRWARVFWFF